MRNLKRAFSLVLALVMVLSVMTIAPVAAADETAPATVTSNFTDAAEIKYTEAVAITGGIGLFAGADGKFMPKGTVTRAQMATIIVKMLYGGDVNADGFKGNGKFSDTANFEGGWAEGYINWCSTLGIVAGYGDGTFKPGNQVTTAEAATMILNALKIDAGEGTWPNTVMAKAEEEDLFEDLKPMPGTNTALTREELAVIALNGLNWTSTDETGWYVSGGTADEKMTFESYKDAQKYADKVGGEVQPLEGRDSLANKVYELKKATGFVTANQATGEKYTEVTLDWAGPATAKFNVVTDANMIGHKVEVWYKETWTSAKNPGLTYAVAEAAEYITLTEDAETAKEYKAAFGTRYDMPASIVLTDGAGYVTTAAAIPTVDGVSYVANTSAPVGTYAIDLETGELCGYIAPAAYTIAKVGYVNATAGQETITVGVNTWNNSADDDEVVEYNGIAKGDYVAYTQLQDMYVVVNLESVTGRVSKVAEKDGKTVVTIDGKEYTEGTVSGTIDGTMNAVYLRTNGVDYQQDYVFYLDPYGNFVCYEAAEGSGFDLSNTFYLLGTFPKTQVDKYGTESITYFARGIDMTGNEAMIPIGIKVGAADPIGKTSIPTEGQFYSVEDPKDTEEKKYDLKVVTVLNSNWNDEEPEAPVAIVYSQGGDPSSWGEGQPFEFGVSYVYTGNCSMDYTDGNGVYRAFYVYPSKATKFIVLEGSADQNYPLEAEVSTGTVKVNFSEKTPMHTIITRKADGTYNIEAMVMPVKSLDHGKNATIIYAPRVSEVVAGRVEWSNLTPSGTDAVGNVYNVYDGITGDPMEITLDKSIDSLECGFYSIAYDNEAEMHKVAVDSNGKPIKVNESALSAIKNNDETDGRKQESVNYDDSIVAMSGTVIWTERFGGASALNCGGVKVIDVRTDEAIAASGLAKITSIDQLWSLHGTSDWLDFELDICWQAGKAVAIFVEAFNNAAYGMNTLVYGSDYGETKVTVVTGDMHAMGAVIDLPTGVTVGRPGFYNLLTGGNGYVTLMPAKDLGATAVAFGSDSGVPAHDDVFNATNAADLNTTAGFANHDVVEYQVLTTENKTILLVVGAGNRATSGITVENPVDANALDSVVDNTGNGITLANLNAKQNNMCMVYTIYDMHNGNKLLVIDEVKTGTAVNTKDALNAISNAAVINKTDASFTDLAGLKNLVNSGYTFVAKLYELDSGAKLVVTQCMDANVVSGTLSDSDFGKDKVTLSDATALSGTITVPAGEEWLLDLAGKTLSGSANTFFTVNGTLTITDSVGGGKIQGNDSAAAAMFNVAGKLILDDGTLTGHVNTSTNGGAVFVDNGGLFTMNGGAITGNEVTGESAYGAGVYLNRTGNFVMNGGKITENYCKYRGGGVGACEDGNTTASITINDGEITGNHADNRGATLYYYGKGVVTINGGKLGWGYFRGVEADGSSREFELRGTTNAFITGGTMDDVGIRGDGGTSSLTISGSPEIANLWIVDGASGTIGNLASGASITTDHSDALTVKDTTVNHAPGTNLYTSASGMLNIKALDAVGGQVSVDATSAMKDSIITVTAIADTGYELVEILVDGKAITGNTFKVTQDHKVTAVFALKVYDVTPGAENGGTFTVSQPSASMGETITVTTAPADNKETHGVMVNDGDVTVNKVDANTYTFKMPAADVTVKVIFGDIQYSITTAAVTGGTVNISTPVANPADGAVEGTVVTITATPDGSARTEVKVNDGAVSVTDKGNGKYEFIMPDEDVTVTVTFIAAQSYRFATVDNVPSGEFTVEGGDAYGLTPANLAEKVVNNDIHFTVFGTVVVIDYFSEGKSTALDMTKGTVPADKYMLTQNLNLTGWMSIDSDVTIDLNGYTINAVTGGYAFLLNADAAKLTIKDSSAGQTGKIQSGASEGNPAFNVQKGTFILEGGEVNGWKRVGKNGGMIIVGTSSATFTMNGGKLTGVEAGAGSAIWNAGGTVNLNGGEISGNSGGARACIYNFNGAILNIGGDVVIKDNVGGTGGAIWNVDSTIKVTDGTFSGNTVAGNGGAIYNQGTGTVTITGGTFSGNTATGNGGAIYSESTGTVTNTGGTFSGNTAGGISNDIYKEGQ